MPAVNVLVIRATKLEIDGQERFLTKNNTYPVSEKVASDLIAKGRAVAVATTTDTEATFNATVEEPV